MKKGNADGPIVALLLLLGTIIGFLAYLNRDYKRWTGSEELEWKEYKWEGTASTAETETAMSSEQYEDLGINTGSRQETTREKFIQDLEEHVKKMFDMETIE